MHAHSFFSFFFSFLFWIYDVTHQAFSSNNQFRWFIDKRLLVTIIREAVHTEDATNLILLYFESNTIYESLLWVIIAAWQRENIKCLSSWWLWDHSVCFFRHCYATFIHISWTSAFNNLPCLSQRNFAHIFFHFDISFSYFFGKNFVIYIVLIPDLCCCPWYLSLSLFIDWM